MNDNIEPAEVHVQTLVPQNALAVPFSLSVLTVHKGGGSASKELLVGPDGKPIKSHRSLGITAGFLEHRTVAGLAGLQVLLRDIQQDQALVHGVIKGSRPGDVHPIIPQEKLKQAKPGTYTPETRARCLEYIAHPKGLYCLMLDRDDNPEDPTTLTSADELLALLEPILPGIATAGRVVTRSTSSAIRDKQTHDWVTPPYGFHVYLLVRGALERFREIVKARLWNSGHGYCVLASPNKRTGVASVLERTVLDTTVFSPERLDYVANARIAKDAGWYQDRGDPDLAPGSVLDLDAFPALTHEERQAYQQRVREAKAALAPERFRLVKETITAEDPSLSEADVDALATQRLTHMDSSFLDKEFLLQFYHRTRAVRVADLSQDYDGQRLADPAEPEYREGTDAIFHWRKGDWRIVSFAHGLQRIYQALPVAPEPDNDDDMTSLVEQAEREGQQHQNGTDPGLAQEDRPVIRISTDIPAVVNAMEQAIFTLPGGPHLFQRARTLTVIAHGVKPPKWLDRAPDIPSLMPVGPAYVRELATRAAAWLKFDKRSEEWEPALPPTWSVETLLERPKKTFLPLEGIVCAPTLRPDGSLLVTPGYDAPTGLYLDFNGTAFPPVPQHPTFDEARSAWGRLHEVFQDFLFAVREGAAPSKTTNTYLSAALAAVLTLVGRYAIQGNVPLFGVTATAAGSGKGKLVDAIVLIGLGRAAPKMGQTLDDNEELKRLLALALEGVSVCCIDNATHPLGNQYLAMALTARAITGRILGQTSNVDAPWNTVLFATGNNLAYRDDISRRVLHIALDPQMEKPEERTGFLHPNLEEWVRQERPRLLVDALTILRAFFVAGCPSQGLSPWGSFEAWSDLVRNAVVWLGEADPNEGRQDLAVQADEAYERLATLLAAWEVCYPIQETGTFPERTVNQVKQEIALYAADRDQTPNSWDELRGALIPFDKRYDGKSLDTHRVGNALRTIEGRVVGQKRLRRHGEHRHNALWRIESL